jgi:cysteine desulfurase/selenocysteine lyase
VTVFTADESARIRAEFPELDVRVGGHRLVYLDTAATALRPRRAVEIESDFALTKTAAVYRGAHTLAAEATEAYDDARATIAEFVGASPNNLVFTSNATESINLVSLAVQRASAARDSSRFALTAGDEIVVTELEHHANLIPWQEVAHATGAVIRVAPVTDEGILTVDAVRSVMTDRTRIVALSAVSNVLGIVIPFREIGLAAREAGALVVLDACQAAPHMKFNVADSGADFVAFSAHKMYGPTGIGALWGTTAALAEMPVVLSGGAMITRVDYESSDYLPAPAKFEPGTPRLTQAIGWAESVRFLDAIGIERSAAHEAELGQLLYDRLASIDGVTILGTNIGVERVGLVAFAVAGVHPHDVGQFLDSRGIAVRVGHHCAQPLHKRLGIDSSTRISFGVYSTADEIDVAVDAIAEVRSFFGEGQ